ncbi:MAG: hypothetical protein ACI8XC_003467 [Gammaproteobacteria bacterium]|jgi:hypothetical protein
MLITQQELDSARIMILDDEALNVDIMASVSMLKKHNPFSAVYSCRHFGITKL